MAWPTLGSRTAKEQNRTDAHIVCVCVSFGHDREPHENDLTDRVAVCAVDSARASVCCFAKQCCYDANAAMTF